MTCPEFKLTVTKAQEDEAASKLGFTPEMAVELYRLRFRDLGCIGSGCQLSVDMVERPKETTQQNDGDLPATRHGDDVVTEITVTCPNESCPNKGCVQELGETLLRAFGQAPPLYNPADVALQEFLSSE